MYDLIVCGGGPAGVAAAMAAGKKNLRVALIERNSCAGGMATAGLVNPILGLDLVKNNETLFLGTPTFGGILNKLKANSAYSTKLTPSAFDEEQLKIILDQELMSAKVDIFYHTQLLGIEKSENRITGVKLLGKQGTFVLNSKFFIDSTGDGDLAMLSMCPYTLGRPTNNLMQPATMSFRMGGVDKEKIMAQSNIREARALVDIYFQEDCKSGRLKYPSRDFIHFYDYPRAGVLHFNMTRVNGINGCDSRDLTRAELAGREQIKIISDWLIERVPYFKNAFLEKLPMQVGVRETRHFDGAYTMNREDIISGRKFADGIARSAYFIDLHSPVGAGFDHSHNGTKGAVRSEFKPPVGDYYEISFRSLVLLSVPNLLIACRALSADYVAHAAIRVMSPMFSVGEAAGVATTLALKNNLDYHAINGEELRKELAYLDKEPWIL